jgi:hypothetical protein
VTFINDLYIEKEAGLIALLVTPAHLDPWSPSSGYIGVFSGNYFCHTLHCIPIYLANLIKSSQVSLLTQKESVTPHRFFFTSTLSLHYSTMKSIELFVKSEPFLEPCDNFIIRWKILRGAVLRSVV